MNNKWWVKIDRREVWWLKVDEKDLNYKKITIYSILNKIEGGLSVDLFYKFVGYFLDFKDITYFVHLINFDHGLDWEQLRQGKKKIMHLKLDTLFCLKVLWIAWKCRFDIKILNLIQFWLDDAKDRGVDESAAKETAFGKF